MLTCGVAAFVKTPGLSPLKTRLAAGIGKEAAATFYKMSIAAVREVLALTKTASLGLVCPYWAVAEVEGLSEWANFPKLSQGEGQLGSRQDRIYRELLRRHTAAILIGGDCPQLSVETLMQAFGTLKKGHDFVLGPAEDGGYYLMGGRTALPTAVWENVPYSVDTTGKLLGEALEERGSLVRLSELCDGDIADDLPKVLRELQALTQPTPAQSALTAWLGQFLGKGLIS